MSHAVRGVSVEESLDSEMVSSAGVSDCVVFGSRVLLVGPAVLPRCFFFMAAIKSLSGR